MGFMVLRAPRSGRIGLASPDVVAVKKIDGMSKVIALECKNRESAFTVSPEQLDELIEWRDIAGAECYIAWKCSRLEPVFIKLETVIGNRGNIGKKFALEHGISINEI
tara:strand:+ start:5333 stop:5656 length:324 start_codon:yes stop_codon:yes gene_type:complete